MSWAKLSDDYGDDCWTLSDEAFRLHTEALVWNGRKLLDCRISKEDVRRFAKHPDAVKELLDCGWWTEDGDHYIIRHHARYQRIREAVVNQQAANAANGAKGGRPKKPREQASDLKPKSSETQSVSESLTESETERDRPGREAFNGSTDKESSRLSGGRRFWKTPAEMAAEAEAESKDAVDELDDECPDCGRSCHTEPSSRCGCPDLHEVA
ncbi:MAG: hypothetical protein ACR2LA_08420 [Acidimicrobiales bacterium]